MILVRTNRRISCFSRAVAMMVLLSRGVSAQSPPATQAPRFTLEVDGVRQAKTTEGSVIVIRGILFHPQIYSLTQQISPILINPENGSWANNIILSVVDGNGVAQNWPLHLAITPPGSLTLGQVVFARLVWLVAPPVTIAPGTYRLSGILNTSASSGTTGWSGTVTSNTVSLEIDPVSSSPTPDQQVQQFELLAQYDHLSGNTTKAIADLNALLVLQPNVVTALAFEGDLLALSGETQKALSSYNHALKAYYLQQSGQNSEPPIHLLAPQGRLLNLMLSQSGLRGGPQVTIALLNHGIQSPGVLFLDLQITNVGKDTASNVLLNQISFQTLSGTGQVTLNNLLSPQLPYGTDLIKVNAASTVRVFFNVPNTVTSFSISEQGTALDIFGGPSAFTESQTLRATGALVGDVNGDGVVNCIDLDIVKASFGKKLGQPGFDPRADVNGDGVVNVIDLSTVARQLPVGTVCP